MKHQSSILALIIICAVSVILTILLLRSATADETFDPGLNDISIQPIGASIKRCQFSDKEDGTEIKGFKVPNSINNPEVSFEQYRMGDKENGPVCQVPMLRGSQTNSAGVQMRFACFFEMNCSS